MKIITSAACFVLAVSTIACSSSGGLGDKVSLGSLPSASGLVASNIGSSQSDTGLRAAVSGTPPNISDLEFADFYGTLLTRIKSDDGAGPFEACEAESEEFFGEGIDGVGGEMACWMSQSVGGAVSNLMSNSASLCYMKNIPNAASGVEISPSGLDPDSIFSKESSDKLVKVAVEDPEMGNMSVFIKVFGSENSDVGADRYKVTLWFCDGSSVTGYETFLVDTAAKTFESQGANDDDYGRNSFSTSAFINIASDGTVTYDTSKARSALVQWEGAGGDEGMSNKQSISISGDNILRAMDYGDGAWGRNRNYSVAEISGEGASSLKFLQGAIRGISLPPLGEDSWDPHPYVGAVEWRDTVYKSISSSDLLDQIPSDLTDVFFETSVSVDPDLSGYSCSETPSVSISMDFSSEGVAAIQASCEGERFEFSGVCFSDEVQELREIINNSWGVDADDACGT